MVEVVEVASRDLEFDRSCEIREDLRCGGGHVLVGTPFVKVLRPVRSGVRSTVIRPLSRRTADQCPHEVHGERWNV